MNFFKLFPTVPVDLQKDGRVNQMVHTFKSVRPLQNFIDQPSLYTFYEIQNGERPDIVSQRLYGTSEYYWTFFVINEFLHDGYRAWPMSQEVAAKYIEEEYSGYVITTSPSISRDSDGAISEFSNSLQGENRNFVVTDGTRFKLNETITGSISGASGTLKKKNSDLNQLIVKDVTGVFQTNENIDGGTSQASVTSYQVYKYADAPHHFFKIGDAEERTITPRDYINSPLAESTNNYTFKTNRQYIMDKNEERSSIRVLQPEYISQFVEEFENLINE